MGAKVVWQFVKGHEKEMRKSVRSYGFNRSEEARDTKTVKLAEYGKFRKRWWTGYGKASISLKHVAPSVDGRDRDYCV